MTCELLPRTPSTSPAAPATGAARVPPPPPRPPRSRTGSRVPFRGGRRPHRAWGVASAAGLAIVTAGMFTTVLGLVMNPLHHEFGWGRSTVGLAASVTMVLYGVTAPFAAALMDRAGIRRVIAGALLLIAVGAGLTTLMTAAWQLIVYWGVLVGLGSGSLTMTVAATVTQRWFVRRRGLVTGALSAAGHLGQLLFLPVLAWGVQRYDWRPAVVTLTLVAAAVAVAVWLLLRDHPAQLGLRPYGAPEVTPAEAPEPVRTGAAEPTRAEATEPVPTEAAEPVPTEAAAAVPTEAAEPARAGAGEPGPARRAEPTPGEARGSQSPAGPPAAAEPGAARRTLAVLAASVRTRVFWLLASVFVICGASTNGVMWTNFAPAAHDHGMPLTVAAGLLSAIGVCSAVGTLASGWLTDRYDPRLLLAVYFSLRALTLVLLPVLFAASVEPSMVFFVVVYGLVDVATVPPVISLCTARYGPDGPIVFGWVSAAHQVGAGVSAFLGAAARDVLGSYDLVWTALAVACVFAALTALLVRVPAGGAQPSGTGAPR